MHSNIPTRTAIRIGLVLIAACTLAMGIERHFAAWLILRAIPGFASALVLVVVSAWILPRLAHAGRGYLSGTVYAGVGTGIMFAGVACLVMVRTGASSDTAWIVLGVTAVGVIIAIWRVLGDASTSGSERARADRPRDTVSNWRLVFCYGAFGLGYIIPATFLPVMARQAIADADWFAWAWPIFGAAATISTVLAAPLARPFGGRNVWGA